ncbi:MAG: ArsR/SmtB family transcription factor [Algoriphagus aquaeductus]|jgi:DNA-binding transcriptional ArsR family regulator|uniref:ArsR family transcriptional regulator n=1 Tax=Algoriphagus aquaeductus TaxID=475299 RepID=A0A326RSI0_9BACT|nr:MULTISPECIES: metalloregulator ArsR/SmtB family transcription factor [Algoriphagus]PZV83968.1 ArsR family transcriptional regulator [Algoriphagus aquaeductus]
MGITKTDLFSTEQNELAQLAKAFAHPARIAILQYLAKTKSCINGTLVQELGLAQATISQHLRELKELGLIKGSIEGVSVNYCLNEEKWERVSALFNGLFDQLTQSCSSGDCC